ncbi:MAG TPA: ABC transporter permease [Acidimicrobiales bacterium]|nr:ABC transporter permease [Acidimicrobiales bacterium]
MVALVGRRLLAMVPTLLIVSLVVFFLLDLTPGDPARILAGETATPEQVLDTRARLGLDRPLLDRYGDYVGGVFTGDLGDSFFSNRPVLDEIGRAFPITASLALAALGLAVLVAVPAGLLAALRPGGPLDRLVSAVSAFALAVPPFVIGVLFVVFFAVENSLLPAVGYVPFADDPGEWARHLVLPAIALAVAPAAELARQTRGALADALSRDYVRAAQAKGLPRRIVVLKHAAKNAAIPVVTVLGLQIGRVIGGAVVVEQVFALPGFGTLAIQAVKNSDYPMIQGIVLVSGLTVILVNLAVDLSYAYFNPKVRT